MLTSFQYFKHFSRCYNNGSAREILGIASNQVGVVLGKSNFIEDSILWVGKFFFAECAPRTNGATFNGPDDRINQFLWKTKFRSMQYICILFYNFIVDQGNYSALKKGLKNLYCGSFWVANE